MARAGKEIIRRLTAPELREIVREELSNALKPLAVKIDEMDKRLTAKIDELDKRLSSRIDELDKRLISEISMLRSELQYASRMAVLETKLSELEKRIGIG
jgi:phosphoglycerate-specific signal transduction histidine kinase